MDSVRELVQYLAGMFDGEGTVVGPPTRRVAITNTDLALLNRCSVACETLGITTHLYALPWDKKSTKQCYVLVVYGQTNLKQFLKFVPFQAVNKRLKLVEVVNSYKRRPNGSGR